jgi:HAD domain in Swiss Army Knife RNA repair proteins
MMVAIGSRTSGVTNTRMPCRSMLQVSAPLLYLDYENCLHRCDACKTADGIVPSDPSASFFEFAAVLENLLAPYPELQIVLSTSWVEAIGFEAAHNSLPLASLRARVVGSTFSPGEDFLEAWRAPGVIVVVASEFF